MLELDTSMYRNTVHWTQFYMHLLSYFCKSQIRNTNSRATARLVNADASEPFIHRGNQHKTATSLLLL